jgi:tetratricopeptide (TPR) repeat protein
MRSNLKKLLGDPEGAKQDLAEGLKEVPTNEEGWVARGIVLLEQAPEQALADFNKALELNPRSLPALQDKAHVLAKYLKRTEEAIGVLDKTVDLYPEDVRPLAGRGVLLARLGKRQAALRDAEAARVLDHSPPNLYQIAGIYALTSKQNPDDRQEAFRLLAFALRKGFGLSLLEEDRDLDSIRGLSEFGRLVKEAKRTQ